MRESQFSTSFYFLSFFFFTAMWFVFAKAEIEIRAGVCVECFCVSDHFMLHFS